MNDILTGCHYNTDKTQFLVNGFSYGFDLGYRGPLVRKNTAENIPLRVGNKHQLWNKIMAEVQLGRYARPYEKPPFKNYIQSPIGLVPKSSSKNKTRLIFHLSYGFGEEEKDKSFNFHTPHELCTVKYRDLDHAVDNCLKLIKQYSQVTGDSEDNCIIYIAKTDLTVAFRQLPG